MFIELSIRKILTTPIYVYIYIYIYIYTLGMRPVETN